MNQISQPEEQYYFDFWFNATDSNNNQTTVVIQGTSQTARPSCYLLNSERLEQVTCDLSLDLLSLHLHLPTFSSNQHQPPFHFRLSGFTPSPPNPSPPLKEHQEQKKEKKSSPLFLKSNRGTTTSSYQYKRLLQQQSNGTLSPWEAMVVPLVYTANATTTYKFTFLPKNFEQGMQIKVTLPKQVGFLNSTKLVCQGVNGTDQKNFTCTGNSTTKVITLQHGFNFTTSMPKYISFNITGLQNPSLTNQTTDSFKLETLSYFGTKALDSISTYLTVSFNCSSPCKTCSGSASTCTSCQGLADEKYLYGGQCLNNCGNSFFYDSTQTCFQCSSACQTCSGSSTNCTSCPSGYSLDTQPTTTTDGKCKNTSLYYSQYYFYFSGLAVALSVLVLLIKACSCKTNWVQSCIALVSLPEIAGWGFLLFMYLRQTTFFHILTLCAACGVHVILNVVYGLTHQKMIIHQGGEQYRALILDYHCWNTFSVVTAFILTFKFHLIQMSDFSGSRALSGEWPKEVWGVWNMISITYIISCYLIMMGSCGYFMLKNMDRREEWIWNMTLDCIGVSTYMVLLLLISSCQQCFKKASPEQISSQQRKEDISYNKVDDLTKSSAMLEDALTKLVRPNRPPVMVPPLPPLRPLPPLKKSFVNRHDTITEDGMSTRRKLSPPPPPQTSVKKREDRYKELEKTPPKKKLPPPPEPVKPTVVEQPKEEINMLKQYIDFLKEEKNLLKEERMAMIKEREKILDQELQRQRNYLNLEQKLNHNQQQISKERHQLEALRRQFLHDMDTRMQQKLEDWEAAAFAMQQQSMRPPTPTLPPKKKQTAYSYEYSPDVSVYDQIVQTDVRKSKVKDMNVQVGKESKRASTKTLSQQQQPPPKNPPQLQIIKQETVSEGVQVTEPPGQITPVKTPIRGNQAVHDEVEMKASIDQLEESVLEPLLNNQPDNGLVEQEAKLDTEVFKTPMESQKSLQPIGQRNSPFYQMMSSSVPFKSLNQSEENPIRNNNPLFRELTPNNPTEKTLRDSLMEPAFGNTAYFNQGLGADQAEDELNEAQVEPMKEHDPYYRDVSPMDPKLQQRSLNESMLEPIRENAPQFRNVTSLSKAQPAADIENNPQQQLSQSESMIEPIKSNAPYLNTNTSQEKQEREFNEQFIEPLGQLHHALYQDAPPQGEVSLTMDDDDNEEGKIGQEGARQAEDHQSMIEPLRENEPLYRQDSSLPEVRHLDTQHDSVIEPLRSNHPYFNQAPKEGEQAMSMRDSQYEPAQSNKPYYEEMSQKQFEMQTNQSQPTLLQQQSSQLLPPANSIEASKPPPMTEQKSKVFSEKAESSEFQQSVVPPPYFERLEPQLHSKEDIEVHPTEVPTIQSDHEELREMVPPIHELAQQPIAKKIKKILYSDKSESSIDEMMEDTPSNYNIPNGRLDGRSLGLKAILLHEKKRNKQLKAEQLLADQLQIAVANTNNPRSSNQIGLQDSARGDKLQKTLQPASSDQLSNSKGLPPNQQHQYFSPMRGAAQPGNSQGKVNNLFDNNDSEVQLQAIGNNNGTNGLMINIDGNGLRNQALISNNGSKESKNSKKQIKQTIINNGAGGAVKGLKKQFKAEDNLVDQQTLSQTIEIAGGVGGSGRLSPIGVPELIANPYSIKTNVPYQQKPPKLTLKK